MDGKVALEEHFSTELNNRNWNAKGEEDRNGKAYAQDVERRLLDPDACVAEMDRAGIEMCIMSLTSPGVQSIVDPGKAVELARESNEHARSFMAKHPKRSRRSRRCRCRTSTAPATSSPPRSARASQAFS